MSNWSLYLNRTSQLLRDNTSRILRMQGSEAPSRRPKTLFTFNSRADLQQFATGCDSDIGGLSTVHLDLDVSEAHNTSIQKKATAKLWGEMNLAVKPGLEGKVRTGYAGFRNKHRPTLFGEMMEDVSHHRYLVLRLRLGGDPRTRNSYFVNIQTDGPVTSDLWQHRLFFQRSDGGWEDLFIPFESFVLTNSGSLSSHQITMYREKVRTFGISVLGGNSGSAGTYELGIDSIHLINEEDVQRDPDAQHKSSSNCPK